MKIYGIGQVFEDGSIIEDYSSAAQFGKTGIGKEGVYYKDGLKKRFAAYGEIERYFKRVHEVNGKLCCGSATFAYYKLILICGGKEITAMMTENEREVDGAVAGIKAIRPKIPYGFIPREA